MSHADGHTAYPQPYAKAPRKNKKPRRWPWVLGMVSALFAGIMIGSLLAAASPPATVPTVTASGAPIVPPAGGLQTETWNVAEPEGSYTDGKYEVGAEIQPGTYKTDGSDNDWGCTWEKFKTADDNAIASSADVVHGRGTLTIKPGGYIKFTGGCRWVKQ